MSLKTYLQEQESLLNNFKVKNNLAPNIMKDVFQFREPLCNLSSVMSAIMTRKVTTICHGLSSATHLSRRMGRSVKGYTIFQFLKQN